MNKIVLGMMLFSFLIGLFCLFFAFDMNMIGMGLVILFMSLAELLGLIKDEQN
jgi:hypothetical protein